MVYACVEVKCHSLCKSWIKNLWTEKKCGGGGLWWQSQVSSNKIKTQICFASMTFSFYSFPLILFFLLFLFLMMTNKKNCIINWRQFFIIWFGEIYFLHNTRKRSEKWKKKNRKFVDNDANELEIVEISLLLLKSWNSFVFVRSALSRLGVRIRMDG